MYKNKKKISTFFIIVALCFFSLMPSNIAHANEKTTVTQTDTYATHVTEWIYRIVDGKEQRRLWSHSYQKWLTDWLWVD